VTATAATCPKSVRDEAAEVMCCLRESLREPAFASALALVLCGRRKGEESDSAERVAPDASAESGEGWHE
jgi:hypothetical protein